MASHQRSTSGPRRACTCLVHGDRIRFGSGVISRTAHSVLFVIPWGRYWIIGTTNTDWDLDLAHPARDQLGHPVPALPGQPAPRPAARPRRRDRRLRRPPSPCCTASEDASELSREHAVATPVPGLITVAGGNYTTYRVMAADAVDAAARGLDRRGPALSDSPRDAARSAPGRLSRCCGTGGRASPRRVAGCTSSRIEHLLQRFGSRIGELLDEVARRPELGKPLEGTEDYLVRRGLVRRGSRGGPPPRRRARQAHPHLDRDVRPRPRRRPSPPRG